MLKKRKTFRRVDFQVSVFMAVIVCLCSVCIFLTCYYITYQDMINGLSDRVFSIYEYVESFLDISTMNDINVYADQEKPSYKAAKEHLESIKKSTGVRYLYTAKEHEGNLIYVIDGLDKNAADFRYPGDLIEPEIHGELYRALAGEVVLPDEIKMTEWGKIFIAYLPIHQDDQVIGVLGIEFEAEHQYNTYRFLRFATPMIILVFTMLSVLFAVIWFRRISNPLYHDMSNTDQLTQLKNRNAFEVDMKNIVVMQGYKHMGLIAMDLNDLKYINDTFGHEFGDSYIQTVGKAIQSVTGKGRVAYRVGGDEFVIVIHDIHKYPLQKCVDLVLQEFDRELIDWKKGLSLAVGFASFDDDMDKNIMETYKRADAQMYMDKARLKKQKLKEG